MFNIPCLSLSCNLHVVYTVVYMIITVCYYRVALSCVGKLTKSGFQPPYSHNAHGDKKNCIKKLRTRGDKIRHFFLWILSNLTLQADRN